MQQINRDIVFQPFETFNLSVQVTPTQISTAFTKVDLIDSFVISVDAGAANNVFIGGPGVTTTNGLEIVAGAGPVEFVIENTRQMYELQEPVIAIAETLQCTPNAPKAIPFIIWDLSQIYLIAIAITMLLQVAGLMYIKDCTFPECVPMTVRVRTLQGGAGGLVTSFSDTFNRASGFLGSNWFMGGFPFTPAVQPVELAQCNIGASTLDFAQCARWTSVFTAVNPNAIWHAQAIVIPTYMNNYNALNGFVQSTLVQATVGAANMMLSGPSVLASADQDNCYYLEADVGANLLRVLRNRQSTLSVVGAFAGTVTNGDILRLAYVNTGAQIDLTVTKNAVVQATVSDATAQRITFGGAGLFNRGVGGACTGLAEYRNFSCGRGA